MSSEGFLSRTKKFFREDTGAVVGAYFDGERLFVAQLTDKFETVEAEADGSEAEQLAEQIALICKRKGWSTSEVGFCLRAEDAVTFQTEVGNVPAKEIPALVKSWARAQAGADAVFASAQVGEELWMETLPRTRLEEFRTAFKKFGLNLRGLSVMPGDVLSKDAFERSKFISEVVRERKAPNLLARRGGVWSWKKISQAAAAILSGVLILLSAKIFFDYRETSEGLEAAESAVENLRGELAIKKALDADVAELHRLNRLCAAQGASPTKLNLLVNLGKVAGGGVRLTSLRIDEKSLELEGIAVTPDAVKSYLSRVKSSVVQSARLESSTGREDGRIAFVIRAAL